MKMKTAGLLNPVIFTHDTLGGKSSEFGYICVNMFLYLIDFSLLVVQIWQ